MPIPRPKPMHGSWAEGRSNVTETAPIVADILVISAGLQKRLGSAGVLLAARVAGLVDTHAAAISVATIAASGKITSQGAVAPILAALTSNTLPKIITAVIITAVTSGSSAFAR